MHWAVTKTSPDSIQQHLLVRAPETMSHVNMKLAVLASKFQVERNVHCGADIVCISGLLDLQCTVSNNRVHHSDNTICKLRIRTAKKEDFSP